MDGGNQMSFTHQIGLVILLTTPLIINANPFTPKDDHQILERLPKQMFQSETNVSINKLRDQVNANPKDWLSASQLAQLYIELSQTLADPRYMGYAQAVLNPWWQSSQPPLESMILRAIIRQNAHNFSGAMDDLEQILKIQPGHVQANLIKATIATVQGKYEIAKQHCQRLMRRSSMMLALICQSTATSLSGNAKTSYRLLHQVMSINLPMPEKEKSWGWTSLAEIAWRIGDYKAADRHFQTALQSGFKDIYCLRGYADFLLQQKRPLDVIHLLASETLIDSLFLRLTIAEKNTDSEHFSRHNALLNQRFKENRKRGSTLHQGDEAKFMLQLMNQPKIALQLARQNWQLQREPVDTYILLQSALAVSDYATVQAVTAWLENQGTEDVMIKQILVIKKGNGYEI